VPISLEFRIERLPPAALTEHTERGNATVF